MNVSVFVAFSGFGRLNGPTYAGSAVRVGQMNAGILALRVYAPALYVDQEELENNDGVSGKYTRGLGLTGLSCCHPKEDAVSMALTVVKDLLQEFEISTADIGKIFVSSESREDNSKSISSYLRMLFPGNETIEGADVVHACYGMTSALLSSLDWVESKYWDKRLGIVVGTDIAQYPPGDEHKAARATGGAGAVAILIGRDAPLVVNRESVSIYAAHTQEFCRPVTSFPFPEYDGSETTDVFMQALHKCFAQYIDKSEHSSTQEEFSGSSDADFCISHAPFPKLVRKSFIRLACHRIFRDFCCNSGGNLKEAEEKLVQDFEWRPDGSLPFPKELERACSELVGKDIDEKVVPGLTLAEECGNWYTASLYGALACLVENKGASLTGKSCLMYAFGSGVMAALFIVHGRSTENHQFNLSNLSKKVGFASCLKSRKKLTMEQFSKMQQVRASGGADEEVLPEDFGMRRGTFYLNAADDRHRKDYQLYES